MHGEVPESSKKLSNGEAFFSSWKSLVGVGVYSMPYAFYQGSPLLGFLVFVLVACLTRYTTSIMSDLQDYLLNQIAQLDSIASKSIASLADVDIDASESKRISDKTEDSTDGASMSQYLASPRDRDDEDDKDDKDDKAVTAGAHSPHSNCDSWPKNVNVPSPNRKVPANKNDHRDDDNEMSVVESGTDYVSLSPTDAYTQPRYDNITKYAGRTHLAYPDIADIIMGSSGKHIALWSIVIAMWGSCVAYINFITQVFKQFILKPYVCPGDDASICSDITLGVPLTLCIFLIVVALKLHDLRKLYYFNLLGVLLTVLIIILILIKSLRDNKWRGPHIASALTHWPTFDSLVLCLGVSLFTMEGLMAVSLSIKEQMKKKDDYGMVLKLSMAVYAMFYILFGFLGVITFDDPNSRIVMDFDEKNLFYQMVAVICCLQVLFTYPLITYATFILVENEYQTVRNHFAATFRIFLVVSTGVVATFIPHYGAFLAVGGCFTGATSLFVIPFVCYIFVHNKESRVSRLSRQSQSMQLGQPYGMPVASAFRSKSTFVLNIVLLCFSVLACSVALYSSVQTEFT